MIVVVQANEQLPIDSQSQHLTALSKARQALVEARSFDDIQAIRDKIRTRDLTTSFKFLENGP